MYISQRSPLLGTIIKHRLAIILLLTTMFLSVWAHEQISEYREIEQVLNSTINKQSKTIQSMESEKSELQMHISVLEEEKNKLKEEKIQLENKIDEISKKQKQEAKQKKKKESATVQTTKRDFKSYMSYTAITNRSSTQYKLQQKASTDGDGIRCLDSKPMVAVGTGWGLKVGDVALIICENGNKFEVIIGDVKANAHTGADNKTTVSNGCRCEFIVDMKSLNDTVKSRGNVAALKKYSGYITNVIKM